MAGSLTNPPSDVIRKLLIDLSVGSDSQTADWSVFNSDEPDEPDKVITIYDTTPILQGQTQPDGEVQSFYGIQVRVRANTFSNAWARANTAYTILDPVINQVVTIGAVSYNVHCMNRMSGPIHIGKESPTSKRDLFTINYTTSIRQIP